MSSYAQSIFIYGLLDEECLMVLLLPIHLINTANYDIKESFTVLFNCV